MAAYRVSVHELPDALFEHRRPAGMAVDFAPLLLPEEHDALADLLRIVLRRRRRAAGSQDCEERCRSKRLDSCQHGILLVELELRWDGGRWRRRPLADQYVGPMSMTTPVG